MTASKNKVVRLKITLDILVPEEEYTPYLSSNLTTIDGVMNTLQECVDGGMSCGKIDHTPTLLSSVEDITAACEEHGTDPEFFLWDADEEEWKP